MKIFFKLEAIVGVMALAAAGSAFANTGIANGQSGNGSVFLNVWDATNQTSYVYDTGLHLNSFTGTATSSYDLSSDANWTSFITAAGSDALQYTVVAENSNGTTNTYNADFTSNATLGTGVGKVGSTSNDQLTQVASLDPYINAINLTAQSSTSSLTASALSNDAAYYGDSFNLGSGFKGGASVSGVPIQAALGTSLKFYQLGLNGDGSTGSLKALVTTFAGTWDMTSAGLLTYTVAVQTVPLPKSWALLLSGLVLMGVIARRGKTADGDSFSGFAA